MLISEVNHSEWSISFLIEQVDLWREYIYVMMWVSQGVSYFSDHTDVIMQVQIAIQ